LFRTPGREILSNIPAQNKGQCSDSPKEIRPSLSYACQKAWEIVVIAWRSDVAGLKLKGVTMGKIRAKSKINVPIGLFKTKAEAQVMICQEED